MPAQSLSLSRQTAEELASALAVIERQYPDYEIKLVPKNSGNGDATQAQSRVRENRSMREIVEDACRHKALSLVSLVEETGLTKNQIRGVLNAPSEKDCYKRTDQADGSKLYQYTGPERE